MYEKNMSKSRPRKRSTTCAVIGCSNSDYQLDLWKEKICDVHHVANLI